MNRKLKTTVSLALAGVVMSNNITMFSTGKSEETFVEQEIRTSPYIFKKSGQAFLQESEVLIKEKKEREEEEKRLQLIREQEELERQLLIQQYINEENYRRNSVGINLDNLLEPSNITAEELYHVFLALGKEEMCELSWALVDCELETSINALFLASLVAQESSWNKSYRAVTQNNITGYAVFNSHSEGKSFASKYDCIMETARWIKREYLSEGGSHFYGYTSYHVNIDYCLTEDSSQSDFRWSANINNISKTLESYYHKYVKELL